MPSLERSILNECFLKPYLGLVVTLMFDHRLHNIISSPVSLTATKLYIWWNSYQHFVKYCVHRLLVMIVMRLKQNVFSGKLPAKALKSHRYDNFF